MWGWHPSQNKDHRITKSGKQKKRQDRSTNEADGHQQIASGQKSQHTYG
jgi:hypothetical protein